MGGGPPGGSRLMGAVKAEQGCRRPSLLVSSARSVEVMIRPVLAVYHSLPSLQGEGLILSGELTQNASTAGEGETHLTGNTV